LPIDEDNIDLEAEHSEIVLEEYKKMVLSDYNSKIFDKNEEYYKKLKSVL
jgi:hypothetical protein